MSRSVSFLFFLMVLAQVLISYLFQTGPWCVLTLLATRLSETTTSWYCNWIHI